MTVTKTNTSHIYPRRRDQSEYLPYVKGTSEKLRRILGSHEIKSIFYTQNTLHKLLCKRTEWLQKIKSNIVYEIDCSICKGVYFGESKQSLKSLSDEHKTLLGTGSEI